jgi:hypothetical protein
VSPLEGSAIAPHVGAIVFRSTCFASAAQFYEITTGQTVPEPLTPPRNRSRRGSYRIGSGATAIAPSLRVQWARSDAV